MRRFVEGCEGDGAQGGFSFFFFYFLFCFLHVMGLPGFT